LEAHVAVNVVVFNVPVVALWQASRVGIVVGEGYFGNGVEQPIGGF